MMTWLTAKDMKTIAQLLHARRMSAGGLAVGGKRLGELSARFAILADDAEKYGWTYQLDVEERDSR